MWRVWFYSVGCEVSLFLRTSHEKFFWRWKGLSFLLLLPYILVLKESN